MSSSSRWGKKPLWTACLTTYFYYCKFILICLWNPAGREERECMQENKNSSFRCIRFCRCKLISPSFQSLESLFSIVIKDVSIYYSVFILSTVGIICTKSKETEPNFKVLVVIIQFPLWEPGLCIQAKGKQGVPVFFFF